MYGRLLAGSAFEIVPIHDATGLAEGYNRGLRQCRGDLVIFSHDDVEFLADDFREKLQGHMEHCDVLGIAGTRRLTAPAWALSGLPYAYGQVASPDFEKTGSYGVVVWSVPSRRTDRMQSMDGVFLCARRPVAEAIRFDEEVFKGFHLYDLDFTYRAFLNGYRLALANDLYPLHVSGGPNDQRWREDGDLFLKKFANQFTAKKPWFYRSATILVPTRQDIVTAMTPPHWDD
jgi:GT2 family glycosyltransferase